MARAENRSDSLIAGSLAAARKDPAFGLYLAAIATLGFKWLSPLSQLYSRSTWTDLLVAAAAIAWIVSRARTKSFPRPRVFHLALGLYVAAGVLSAAFAEDRGLGVVNVVLMAELCVLAVLTSEFARDHRRLDAIVLVVVVVSLYTAAFAILGLALFYAGVHTSLVGVYGEQLVANGDYARIAAGFETPQLLGSFCIFASAVVAREDTGLARRSRLVTQVALAALVVLSLSRAVIGFAVALVIRAAYRNRDSRRARVAAVGFVIASIAVIGALSFGAVRVDPAQPWSSSYHAPDPHNRRETFVASYRTFEADPVTGKGPGSLPGRNDGEPFRAHLTPLNIAATMGLPALAAMIFLIAVLWRNRRRPTPIATWSGLAGLAIDGLTLDIDHFRNVWVMIGLADAERRPDEAGASREQPPRP